MSGFPPPLSLVTVTLVHLINAIFPSLLTHLDIYPTHCGRLMWMVPKTNCPRSAPQFDGAGSLASRGAV